MGLMILGGLGVIAYTIASRLSGADEQPAASSASLLSAPSTMQQIATEFGTINVAIPNGARLGAVQLDEGRMILRIDTFRTVRFRSWSTIWRPAKGWGSLKSLGKNRMTSTFNAWNVNFASDNVAGAAPEIIAALQEASTGFAMPYGDDDLTEVFAAR